MASRTITRGCLQQPSSNSASLARAFLQLAPPRRHLHNAPPTVLDFLLPSSSIAICHSPVRRKSVSPGRQKQLRRTFASSLVRQQTTAIVNPRKDEEGNDMTVEITARASQRLGEIMAKDSNPNLALRIQVESGGCHGFQYLMSLTTLPGLETSSSESSTAGDSKIAALDEEDTVFVADNGSAAKVVMDLPSLELLKGSKIDYTMELIGSQFKIVDNPLATSSCGCGTSFDIKA